MNNNFVVMSKIITWHIEQWFEQLEDAKEFARLLTKATGKETMVMGKIS